MIRYLILILLLSQMVFAEDIHIGDRLGLRIKGADRDEIVRGFDGFEIESLDEKEGGFEIVVRSYEPGSHRIVLGDRYFDIEIVSSLDEDDKEIYKDLSGESLLTYRKKPLPVIFIGGTILLTCCLIYLGRAFVRRKGRTLKMDPREEYYEGMKNLGEDYVYEVSLHFRRYYDYLTGEKTLSGVYLDNEAGEFLRKLDHMKFAKRSHHRREELVEEAMGIIGRSEEVRRDD